MILQIPSTKIEPIITWEALPADFVLPDDPVENIQQPVVLKRKGCRKISR
jgi:hypothetical protein